MSEPQDARDMLDRAERAAEAGDLATADEWLSRAARRQEEDLGPLHPDLAQTLNNLAIVAERTGRADEAEAFYRRAVAIASASLPPDDPMVVASRQNLEDFCRARGVPIDPPAPVAPAPETAVKPGVPVPPPSPAPPPSSVAPQPAPRQPAPQPSEPLPPARRTADQADAPTPGKGSPAILWMAIGAVVLVAALFVWRPWSSRDAPAPAAAQTVAPPRETPAAAAPAPAPAAPAEPPKAAPRRDDRTVAATPPAAPAPTPSAVTVTAQLCQTFSMNDGNWRCDPAGDSVAPGRLVLYTRVKSPRSDAVVHRWYRGDTLRQSVKLAIQANPTEGYRTFSRQTVDVGDWRVEVRSADGSLQHEQRFAVR